ncbi:MA2B1-like protein, partial [Mya arenaria]
MTMGSDFEYQNAHHWYKNLDKLIHYTNKRQTTDNSKVNLLYSTPSCYTYQLNRANKTWPTKSDDFYPYAYREHSFMTGYFTSRAALKGYIRETNAFLQHFVSKCGLVTVVFILLLISNAVTGEAMGVAQHHDAVSGTEKQQVAYDYAMRLANESCERCNGAIGTKGFGGIYGVFFCDLLNISACSITEQDRQFVMIVYNPLSHSINHWVRLPMIPVFKRTQNIPERKGYMAKNELVFRVEIPALGYSTYMIKMSEGKFLLFLLTMYMHFTGKAISLLEHMSLKFDSNGNWDKLTDLHTGQSVDARSDIVYYHGMAGNCSQGKFQSSGAYIFRPNGTTPQTWTDPPTVVTVDGPLVNEVHTEFSPWVTQVTRQDKMGKEVVVRVNTGMKSDATFYTDANGREIIKRVRNFRKTWNLNQTESVAGNYYPVNSRIFLRDESSGMQFTVLTDRSQGGASIQDGQLELMVHRRLLYDDSLGVGEPMNETGSDKQGLIIRGKMYVHFGQISDAAKFHREFGLRTYLTPITAFTKTDMNYQDYSMFYNTMWSGLKQELPANIHMLTLEQWGGPTLSPSQTQPYLIRLEHFYENGEDPQLSLPVTVNLQ